MYKKNEEVLSDVEKALAELDQIEDPEVLCDIAYRFANGKGVSRDFDVAIKYWKKAAEKGSTLAEYNLGCACWTGVGVEKDRSQALEYWKRAAERGETFSKYQLGCAYWTGEGGEKDQEKAVEWWNKTLKDKHRYGGMYRLGCAFCLCDHCTLRDRLPVEVLIALMTEREKFDALS